MLKVPMMLRIFSISLEVILLIYSWVEQKLLPLQVGNGKMEVQLTNTMDGLVDNQTAPVVSFVFEWTMMTRGNTEILSVMKILM